MKLSLFPASARDLQNASEAIAAGLHRGFADPHECRGMLNAAFAEFERIERPSIWGAFWSIDLGSGEPVGLCGFKDRPDRERMVEIAYLTFPLLQGRGFATAMVRLLIEHANTQGSIEIRANTLPEESASTRVLRRVGFAFQGEVIDPDDGPGWRWRKI